MSDMYYKMNTKYRRSERWGRVGNTCVSYFGGPGFKSPIESRLYWLG